MNVLNFDQQGHLVPYDLIDTDWKSFVETFNWNAHRRILTDSFLAFLTELNRLSIGTFTIWIDGSFVTQKECPGDLDAVLVLSANKYEAFEKQLRQLRIQFRGLDLYFVKLIEEGKPNRFLYISDRTEWLFQFTMTRPDRVTKRKFPKGSDNMEQ